MTLLEAITRINYALRGTDDDAPTIGAEEADYWVSLLNRKKDELYQDVARQWSFVYKSTSPNETGTVATAGTTTLTGTGTFFTDYNVGDTITVDGETARTIATIVSDTSLTVTLAFSNTASAKTFTRDTIIKTGVQSYSVHRSLLGLSDQVYVVDTNDNKVYLDLVHPQEVDRVNQQVHLSGGNPQLLTFTLDLASTDSLIGGSLVLPGYYLPADISTATELLPVPDPNWLAIATASEIAFADIVYEDRAEALNARANALWKQMVSANRRATYGSSRKTPYNTYRIRDTRVG
jgi:hypothetical protein